MEYIKSKYFESSIYESIYESCDKEQGCFFCGETSSPVAELDGGLTIFSSENIDGADKVCLKCLKDRKYGFEQEVEYGSLSPRGLVLESERSESTKESSYYASDILPVEKQLNSMDSSQFQELMYTPPFRAWQGAVWLVHCNDFMKFIGTWQHEDFVKHSPNGDAKAFYDDICLYGGDDLYDSQFGPNKSEYAECTFYAFECPTCKEKRGYIDNA